MIKKISLGCFAMDFRPAKVLQKSDYANRWRLYFSFLSVIFFLRKTKTIQKKLYSLQLYAVFLLSLHKKSCARQFESKLSLRSLAVSLHSAIASKLHTP